MYASRLYTNRSVLKDIPKTFMPIEKEDLPGRRVHRLIEECLERSAVIAYQARPRSRRIEHDTINAGMRMLALTKTKSSTDQTLEPSWGKIAHPGWSSPAAKELPGLEYATVVDELVDLVEAKAVSLAPIDPLIEPGPDGTPVPDPRVIDEIARSSNMGMRTYLRYLIDIGVVPDDSLTVAFLAAYERARFSSEPLSDDDFQTLMRMFAELLRGMTPVDVEMLHFDDSEYPSDAHSHSYSETSSFLERKPSPHSRQIVAETSSIPSTYSASGSVRHHRPPPRRVSEDSVPSLSSLEHVQSETHPLSDHDMDADDDDLPDDHTETGDTESLRTAPTTAPRSRSRPRPPLRSSTTRMYSAVSRLPPNDSGDSLHSDAAGSVVHHALEPQRSFSSTASSRSRPRTRPRRGNGSRNGSGVIRLASQSEHGLGLPFRIEMPRSESD